MPEFCTHGKGVLFQIGLFWLVLTGEKHKFDAKTNRDTTLYIDLPFTPTTIDTR